MLDFLIKLPSSVQVQMKPEGDRSEVRTETSEKNYYENKNQFIRTGGAKRL